MLTVLYVQISSGMAGASHSLLTLAQYIRKYNVRPIIVGQQDREGLWEECEKHGITYYPLYLTSWARSDLSLRDILYIPNRLNTFRRLVKICRDEHVDLVHTNLHFCLDGALAAKYLGIPHVFHVRDEFSPLYKRWFGGTKRTVHIMQRLSDRIITVSESVAQDIEQHGAKESVRTVLNPVEIPPRPVKHDSNEIRKRFGLPQSIPLIGLFGVIAERKGQLDLVQALRSLLAIGTRVHAIVVGQGYDAYEAEVRATVKTHNLEDSITFIRHQADVWPLLRSVDVVAVPSRAEGFGRIVVEGMAAGKPVVAASVGGIVEIIEHRVNGLLVPPASPQDLADALYELLVDHDLAQRLAKKGRRDAENAYSPESHARNILSVYDDILR